MPREDTHNSAGTDSPPANRGRAQRFVAFALLAAGVMLIGLVVAYYAYGLRAKAAIGDYSSSQARPAPIATAGSNGPVAAAQEPAATGAPSATAEEPPARTEPPAVAAVEVPPRPAVRESKRAAPALVAVAADSQRQAAPAAPVASSAAPAQSASIAAASERTQPLRFAQRVISEPEPAPQPVSVTPQAAASASPQAASAAVEKPEAPDYAKILEQALSERIDAVTAEAAKYSPPPADLPGDGLAPPTRMRIPIVGIDSEVRELRIIETSDSRTWETPKHIVGHIPTSALPGDQGKGWYFGHLESPFSGEGNVFLKLPDLAEMVAERADDPFYIFLETQDRKFVYQIYHTEIIHQDEFAMSDSGEHDITLVTCYPRFIYDHRLLVTAALVGVLES